MWLRIVMLGELAPEELTMRGQQRIAEGHQPLVHLG
jgi:hypothetical protein